MDIIELGAIGEMVGGVAVLATLIYLAVQITGSRQALKTQTHHNLLMAGQRPIELTLRTSAWSFRCLRRLRAMCSRSEWAPDGPSRCTIPRR